MTIDGSLQRFEGLLESARTMALRYVAMFLLFWCPYEGDVDPNVVLRVGQRLMDMGCYEVSYGDTIGVGVPSQVEVLCQLLLERMSTESIAMHFHDTRDRTSECRACTGCRDSCF